MILLKVLAAVIVAGIVGASAPPPARVVPFSQSFYGTVRSDPYHWMEAGGAPLDKYMRGQSSYTTALLQANPGRVKVVAALREAFSAAGAATTTFAVTRVGSCQYYLQSLPGSAEPSLLARTDQPSRSIVIVNAKALPKDTVIGWFEPSPSGKKIAYGVTASSENVVIHVCNADGAHDSCNFSTAKRTSTSYRDVALSLLIWVKRSNSLPVIGSVQRSTAFKVRRSALTYFSIPFFYNPRFDYVVEPIELPAHVLPSPALEPVDPANPMFAEYGYNALKGRLRAHRDVAARFYSEAERT